MRLILTSFILFLSFYLKSQSFSELGIQSGFMFYNGDINESKLFYNISFNKGLLWRHSFNNHYAIKINLNNAVLRASTNNLIRLNQFLENITISSQIYDLALQGEFNMLPFNPLHPKGGFISPYITAGIGLFFANNKGPALNIPFGTGIKLKLNNKIIIACEFTFRKTFNDNIIDDISNEIIKDNRRSFLFNNDWYSVSNIILTYNIGKAKIKCPTYKDLSR
jgi:hypothetical protein